MAHKFVDPALRPTLPTNHKARQGLMLYRLQVPRRLNLTVLLAATWYANRVLGPVTGHAEVKVNNKETQPVSRYIIGRQQSKK